MGGLLTHSFTKVPMPSTTSQRAAMLLVKTLVMVGVPRRAGTPPPDLALQTFQSWRPLGSRHVVLRPASSSETACCKVVPSFFTLLFDSFSVGPSMPQKRKLAMSFELGVLMRYKT